MGTTKILGLILKESLEAWNNSQSVDYKQELYELLNEYDAEMEKPSYEEKDKYPNLEVGQFRDNAALDDISRRMHNLGEAFLTAKGKG